MAANKSREKKNPTKKIRQYALGIRNQIPDLTETKSKDKYTFLLVKFVIE